MREDVRGSESSTPETGCFGLSVPKGPETVWRAIGDGDGNLSLRAYVIIEIS